MKWPEDYINKIICDDCFEVMRGMPDNCIDTIITDPPYGLEFMGKEWDKFPIRDRGKRLTGGGNPTEARGFGKNVAYGNSKESLIAYQEFSINWATEALRVAKPGATLLCFGGTRTYHRLACAIEDAGWILKDCIMWLYGSGFPKATDISKQIDKKAGKLKIQGKGFVSAGHDGRKAEMKQTLKYRSDYGYKYKPKGEKSQIWNGWKSHGLKPAYEPILVAMKPNEGSYANNALKYGVAGLNIDGGRIEIEDITKDKNYRKNQATVKAKSWWNPKSQISKNRLTTKGRYPTNLILDEEAGRLLDEQSGVRQSGHFPANQRKHNPSSFSVAKGKIADEKWMDSGGASRFFYCAKSSKAERNRGCEGLEAKYNDDSRKDKNAIGCNNPRNRSGTPKKNSHPTVKPLSLMKYLCTITKTPTGGIVLDPFCGSGTTSIACKELKRDYIGIDNQPEYCEIARRRVNATTEPLF